MSLRAFLSRRLVTPQGVRSAAWCNQLLTENDAFRPGLYRLSFGAASYHHAENTEGLYPVVEITFQVREGESQFHIPLLLSPYGYTTYRGS